jgi:hypothetical protein
MEECSSCAGKTPDIGVRCTHCGALLKQPPPSPAWPSPLFSRKIPTPFFLVLYGIFGAMLLVLMAMGAFFDNRILKVIAGISAGAVFLLIIPFSWWLNGKLRR